MPAERLKLQDWLAVFRFVDANPTLTQGDIVKHFQTLENGRLSFDQSTLCRKLGGREKLEAQANENTSALARKRVRVVIRPDVERALALWVSQMEENQEKITLPMLAAKRKSFEELFQVPEAERLKGTGWIPSFRQTYGMKVKSRPRRSDKSHATPVAEDVSHILTTSMHSDTSSICDNGSGSAVGAPSATTNPLWTERVSASFSAMADQISAVSQTIALIPPAPDTSYSQLHTRMGEIETAQKRLEAEFGALKEQMTQLSEGSEKYQAQLNELKAEFRLERDSFPVRFHTSFINLQGRHPYHGFLECEGGPST